MNYDPFLNILPIIDLHGINRDMVKYIVDDFIRLLLYMVRDKVY